MTTASKSYEDPTINTDQLYWPEKNQMHDMVRMDVLEYIPISRSTATGSSTEITGLSNIQSANNTQILDFGAGGSTPRTRKTLATILLPVPNDINYSDDLQWGAERMGILGKMIPSLAGAAVNNPEAVSKRLQAFAQGGISELLVGALKNVPGAPPPESLTQGIGGKILNPYIEQIFKGISMRSFNFTWKLVPRNKDEQYRIHHIIKNLRYYSLPNYSSTGGLKPVGQEETALESKTGTKLSDRWLTVPNVFALTWMQAGTNIEIQSLPKIKPCVLQNVKVNYTPDNAWATHINTAGTGLSGPAPVAYDLNLTFQETEIITANDVRQNHF